MTPAVRPHRGALIVTKHLDLQVAYLNAIRQLRQSVVTAATCEDAFELAGEFPLDVIIFDVRTADDLSCCHALRDSTTGRTVPFIILLQRETDYATQQEAAKSGFAAVVSVPCPVADLVWVVRRVIRNRRCVGLS